MGRAGATRVGARQRVLAALTRTLERPLVVDDPLAGGAPAAAIVVLGSPLARDGGLTAVLAERVAGGVALWRLGAAPRIICTGGVTAGATQAEATVMAAAVRAAGVPAAAIVVEDRALTTRANAALVARLVPPGATVWLVTQPFHGRRARRCFRAVGLAPRVWHLADSLQYQAPARALRWLTREYAAWARLLVTRG